MPKWFASGCGKVVASVVISIVLHASLGMAWLSLRPAKSAFQDAATAVDGPDDGEMVITVREPPPDIITRLGPIEPPRLPHMVEIPIVGVPEGPGGIVQAGNPPVAAPSPPQPALGNSLHGKLKAGKSIAYVLDRSSSMGSDGQLRSACEVVKASLQHLSPEARFQIVAYNAAPTMLANQPLPATEENKSRAARWLDTLLAEGSSNHIVGLREALWQQPNAVFLLTDADDLEAKEVKTIRGLVRDRVLLNVVLFGSGSKTNETPLRKLCESTGGAIVGR